MTVQLYLYDAADDLPAFLPFSLSRPLGELRYGAFLLRERWSARRSLPVGGYLTPHRHLRDFGARSHARREQKNRRHSAQQECNRSAVVAAGFWPDLSSGLLRQSVHRSKSLFQNSNAMCS